MARNLAGGGRTWSARPPTHSPWSHESNGGVGGVMGSSERAGSDGGCGSSPDLVGMGYSGVVLLGKRLSELR